MTSQNTLFPTPPRKKKKNKKAKREGFLAMLKFKFFALTNTIQFIEIRQTSSPHTFDSQLKGAD